MSNRFEYQVRFLSADGGPMECVTLLAKSLTVAIDCATTVGAEIGAANFYIVARLDGGNSRLNAMTGVKPDTAPSPDAEPSAL